jgi:uncharacterized surface protein with fasciclin (FAS1) repeats
MLQGIVEAETCLGGFRFRPPFWMHPAEHFPPLPDLGASNAPGPRETPCVDDNGSRRGRASHDRNERTNPMKRSLIGGLAVALVAAVVPMSTSAPVSAEGPTIADVLLSDSSKDDANGFDRRWNDYDIATQAVLLFPDLVAAASDPNASLTLLAPNDQAFRLLATQLTKQGYRTEADVFAAVASLGADTVKAVLTYHLVGAKLDPATVLASDLVQVSTLNGGSFTVDVINKRFAFVQFVDGDPNARNAFLNRVSVGGTLANGYIHGVDRVLRPIDL